MRLCYLLHIKLFSHHISHLPRWLSLAIMPGSSDVWNFFVSAGKVNKDTDLVECTICHRSLKRTKGCTTNLRNHLLNHHRETYLGFKIQLTGSASTSSKVKVSNKTKAKLNAFLSTEARCEASTSSATDTDSVSAPCPSPGRKEKEGHY